MTLTKTFIFGISGHTYLGDVTATSVGAASGFIRGPSVGGTGLVTVDSSGGHPAHALTIPATKGSALSRLVSSHCKAGKNLKSCHIVATSGGAVDTTSAVGGHRSREHPTHGVGVPVSALVNSA